MYLENPESAGIRLGERLKQMSALSWVVEVDRLARFETITVDEALTLLGRRFAGDYLVSRRHIVWLMLEYAFLRFEPDAWHDPIRRRPRRQSARQSRGAAA
jgi:hypothetical protein